MHRSGALTTEARLRGPKSLVPFSLPTHPPGPSALLEHSVNTSELEPPLSSVCELCHPQAPKFMKCCISRSGSLGQSQKGGPVKPGPGLSPSRGCRAQRRDRKPGALLLLRPWLALTLPTALPQPASPLESKGAPCPPQGESTISGILASSGT